MDAANKQFKELLAISGWNQSQAARNLDLTTASVSRYVNDIDKPTKQTLRLFQILLVGKEPNTPSNNQVVEVDPAKVDLGRLVEQLALMEKNDKQNYEVAKRVIESLSPQKFSKAITPSTKTISSEEKVAAALDGIVTDLTSRISGKPNTSLGFDIGPAGSKSQLIVQPKHVVQKPKDALPISGLRHRKPGQK